jgi:hypothetical protein
MHQKQEQNLPFFPKAETKVVDFPRRKVHDNVVILFEPAHLWAMAAGVRFLSAARRGD